MKTSSFRCLLLVLFSLSAVSSFSQGFIMLSGGGAESAGGWSDAPYRWVVEHAQNKRIAVVGYDSAPTEWIPDYFISFGAKAAKNFIVPTKAGADLQSLYDSLITYNGVFIRGGDQSVYYQNYKGTKTQKALQYIYDHGGVLSGTSAGTAILSPIVYTAVVASVDPANALLNAYSSQITLANDFLNTLPKKYIYDTHFNERGRFGRLPAFMASWFKKTKEIAIGVGVGDHTALCIGTDGKAKIFGTGSVNFIYNLNSTGPYDTAISMLRAKNMKLTQLIHGCAIDLNTGAISGLSDFIQPAVADENGRLTIFLSGTDYPSDDAYDHFVNRAGGKNDAIVIITGNDLSRANDVKSKLLARGATEVYTVQALTANQSDASARENINKAKKFFVIANDYAEFINFSVTAGNGSLLTSKLKQPGMISFFAGDNARFAGKTVINKYTGSGYTSYHGTLEFLPGLGLLKTTAIMPNAFISAETYENTVSGLPYAMVSGSLKYGLYLTGNTFAAYSYTDDNKSYFKNLAGSFPLIFIENDGTLSGLANQGPYSTSRNIAGFESMNLKFLGISDTVTLNKNVPTSVNDPVNLKINIYPNPAKDLIHIQGSGSYYSVRIADMTGRIISDEKFVNNTGIDLGYCPEGIYLVNICDLKLNTCFSTKLCLIK